MVFNYKQSLANEKKLSKLQVDTQKLSLGFIKQ